MYLAHKYVKYSTGIYLILPGWFTLFICTKPPKGYSVTQLFAHAAWLATTRVILFRAVPTLPFAMPTLSHAMEALSHAMATLPQKMATLPQKMATLLQKMATLP